MDKDGSWAVAIRNTGVDVTKARLAVVLALLPAAAHAQNRQPYAGLAQLNIKALSEEQVTPWHSAGLRPAAKPVFILRLVGRRSDLKRLRYRYSRRRSNLTGGLGARTQQ
jgi:hypothetical protein